jgi:hypothetical protein
LFTAGTTCFLESSALTLTAVQQTFSIYVKAGSGLSHVQVRASSTSNLNTSPVNTIVRLSDGAMSGTTGVAAVTDAGDGWWRIQLTWTPAAGTWYVGLWVWNDASIPSAAGTENYSIWGAQLNLGPTALPYVPTVAAAVYAPAVDWLAAQSVYTLRGEAAATNLMLYSADMGNGAWQVFNTGATKVGAATALGALPMYRVNVGSVGGSFGASSAVYQFTVPVAATTTYTASCIARAVSGTVAVRIGVNISGADIASSDITLTTTPQLLSVTATTTAGGGAGGLSLRAATAGGVVGDIEVGGAQLETGTRASSRILTLATTATRAADTLIEPVATSVAGTMVIDYVPSQAGSQVIAQLDDTTANERHRVMNDGIYDVVDGGVTQASVDGGTPVVGALNRVAVTWQANRFAISLNGGAAIEDFSGTVPTTTRLLLADVANAFIVRQRLISGRAVNISQLQALSA